MRQGRDGVDQGQRLQATYAGHGQVEHHEDGGGQGRHRCSPCGAFIDRTPVRMHGHVKPTASTSGPVPVIPRAAVAVADDRCHRAGQDGAVQIPDVAETVSAPGPVRDATAALSALAQLLYEVENGPDLVFVRARAEAGGAGVTVSADGTVVGAPTELAVVIVVDTSGSMEQPRSKIRAARRAAATAMEVMPDGTLFALAAGTDGARCAYPCDGVLVRADTATRAEAAAEARRLPAGGGTAISTWLDLTRELLEPHPGRSIGRAASRWPTSACGCGPRRVPPCASSARSRRPSVTSPTRRCRWTP